MDEARIREQCDRLDNQELFGLMINRFFSAGQGEDVLAEAELMKNILGQRLGFPVYQPGYATYGREVRYGSVVRYEPLGAELDRERDD